MIVKDCYKCDISINRKNIVNRHGAKSKIMFIGEAPGYREDKYGIPFIGKPGELLTMCLEAVNLRKEWFSFVNTIRCRPPTNRTPSDREIENCMPHLLDDIADVNPTVIVTLGNVATKALFKLELPMSKLHGQLLHLPNTQCIVVPMYHPSYILRNGDKVDEYIKDLWVISLLYKKIINPNFIPIKS